MTSDFEKALARAAAESNARDEAKAQQEREDAEKAKLAHSIIDPYLAELGPQVVKTLRDLGIPTISMDVGVFGHPQTKNAGCWEFVVVDDGYRDIRQTFALNSRGQFAAGFFEEVVAPVRVGLIEGHRISWEESSIVQWGTPSDVVMLANTGNRKTYVSNFGTNENPHLLELSEFIVHFIYQDMKK